MDKKAKERVAIAKDALAWIKAGALIPETGVYLQPEITPSREDADTFYNKQLRDIVLGNCKVCAKGAIFLAKAVRYNNVLVCQWMKADECDDNAPLREHFSWEQLDDIEAAFEGWSDQKSNPKSYISKYPNDKDRLIAILNNIIKNKGTFIDPCKNYKRG